MSIKNRENKGARLTKGVERENRPQYGVLRESISEIRENTRRNSTIRFSLLESLGTLKRMEPEGEVGRERNRDEAPDGRAEKPYRRTLLWAVTD